MAKFHTLRQITELKGKRVLLRLDLNAPVKHGHLEASDLWKLRSSLRTLEYLVHQQAKVIIVSHFGRPVGRELKYSLQTIVKKLGQMLGQKIELWEQPVSRLVGKSHKLDLGQVVCLENIRFQKGEERNDRQLAKQLAALADIYVNDAFGVIQRPHASTQAVTRYLPSYAGFLMEYEVTHLFDLLKRSRRPIVAVMGGSKISSKIGLIRKMLDRVDYLLLGGALANNVLMARDVEIGKSLVDRDVKQLDGYIMNNKLKLPVDARVSSSLTAASRLTAIGKVRASEIIYDLGPDTIELYCRIIKKARTVIWNGPLGYFEDRRYAKSTNEFAKCLASVKARQYVGGGETIKSVLQNRLEDKIYFVSSGGGAMLSLLEGQQLPVLKSLIY